jgi:hypothetical protein
MPPLRSKYSAATSAAIARLAVWLDDYVETIQDLNIFIVPYGPRYGDDDHSDGGIQVWERYGHKNRRLLGEVVFGPWDLAWVPAQPLEVGDDD